MLTRPVNGVCWEELEAPLTLVLAHIAKQVDVYDWLGSAEAMDQYKRFMLTWAALARHPRVRRQAWGGETRQRRVPRRVRLELVAASATHTGHLQAHRVRGRVRLVPLHRNVGRVRGTRRVHSEPVASTYPQQGVQAGDGQNH